MQYKIEYAGFWALWSVSILMLRKMWFSSFEIDGMNWSDVHENIGYN